MADMTRPGAGVGRREFLTMAAATLAAGGWASRSAPRPAAAPGGVKAAAFEAVALDGFAVFDPRPIAALAETLFPGKGAAMSATWRTRQFEYQWLRALSNRYADFLRTTDDALVFAARQHRLELTPEKRARLTGAFLELETWPDAAASLRSLKEAGVRLAFLSNMTGTMLQAGIDRAGLGDIFEHVLSSDAIRTYKPDPRAYRMALDAFHLEREAILFGSFAGWDAAGAASFGYPTFWVNRLDLPDEELGVSADATGRDLRDLVTFVKSRTRPAARTDASSS